MKNPSKNEIKAMADEVKMMTIAEIEALPNMLGKIASMECRNHGFYSFNHTKADGAKVKIFIELVA